MQTIRHIHNRNAVIRFDTTFGVLDAIRLPQRIRQLPPGTMVTLDFSDVRWMRESAMAALIAALASLHGHRVSVRGLESEQPELGAMLLAAA